MSDSDLQLLLDRAAISELVYGYATGLDRRDWKLYRSIFADEIEMDFTSVGLAAGTFKADEWVESAKRLFAGFDATQHTSTNHVHRIDGDRAKCVSNMQAEHFVSDAAGQHRWTIGGYYVNELVRTDSGWKLAKIALHMTWSTGNPEVGRISARKGREAAKSS